MVNQLLEKDCAVRVSIVVHPVSQVSAQAPLQPWIAQSLGFFEDASADVIVYEDTVFGVGIVYMIETGDDELGWDQVHHFYGSPIVPFLPRSSAGCAITDALLAIWFFANAPSVLNMGTRIRYERRVTGAGGC